MTQPPTPVHHHADLLIYSARLVRSLRRHHQYPVTMRVLSVLDELGPQTVTALAQSYACSQPTMTGMIHDLVDQGWVSRKPHPGDARSSLIELSREGAEQLRQLRAVGSTMVTERLAAHPELSHDDLNTAVAVLRAIVDEPSPHPAD